MITPTGGPIGRAYSRCAFGRSDCFSPYKPRSGNDARGCEDKSVSEFFVADSPSSYRSFGRGALVCYAYLCLASWCLVVSYC